MATHIETFDNTIYEDTSETTASWGSGKLSLSPGQIGTSLNYDTDNENITNTRLQSTHTGTVRYFLNTNISSSNFNTGIITGAAYTSGIVGDYALSFNGTSSDYVTILDNDSLSFTDNIFTLSLWINPTNLTGNKGIIRKGGSGANWEYSIILTNNTLRFNAWSLAGSDVYTKDVTLTSGPHHVVITSNGTSCDIYIDGTYKSSATKTGLSMGNGTSNLLIGVGGGSLGPYYMNGIIDEARIYNRYMTLSDISTLYSGGNVSDGLIAKYSFDEGSGGIAYDTSSWESTTPDSIHTFENPGTNMRFKVYAINTSEISELSITYNPKITTNHVGGQDVAVSPNKSSYDIDEEVSINAISGRYYSFSDWDGDLTSELSTETITMNSDKSITANFTELKKLRSKSIELGNKTLTQARLSCTTTSESFTYWLSADGGTNWESVTNNLNHTFTNQGDDLRYEIIDTNENGGTISKIVVSNY